MPEIPKLIRVERVGESFSFKIDGVDFPYVLPASEPIEQRVVQGSFPTVRLSLFAERVEIVDALCRDAGEARDA